MRLEVPVTVQGVEVLAAFTPREWMALGEWAHAWSFRASEAAKAAGVVSELSRAIRAEGDGLFGCGGTVDVRLVEVGP